MKTRIAALVMVALLALYMIFVINYSIVLIRIDQPIANVMGWALLVLPLIGFWALAAELFFIFRAERLLTTLEEEGALPDEVVELLPSGRPDPATADRAFDRYRTEAEAAPESWRAWLRLGLAYDASGDRKRARWATRRAIALSRAKPTPTA
ncbi:MULTISPECIES: hypothetical protein [unclassified Salinibacterium]|uniref:hypothetical protein n=1 Tax=unclassified Salinibacterium TaxID=2632331 RepID=UPI0018CFA53F|nr:MULTISPECIES: hypothetical protein [unclassified Salinibacterium]MBH0025310.1 hypothetical protein [Salinibacterium sp. SWN248]MBH0084422.1 hypothetical protein [Salinibacterium sp. SWN167]MBH0117914.1 hypothetical protein [Salinibacterium sp. NG253]